MIDSIQKEVDALRTTLSVDDKLTILHRGPWHVRALVDDAVVCRMWSYRRQDWHYEVYQLECLAIYKLNGALVR